MKWKHLLEGISVTDSERGHDYWTSHCGRGRIQKDGDVEVGRQSGPRRQTVRASVVLVVFRRGAHPQKDSQTKSQEPALYLFNVLHFYLNMVFCKIQILADSLSRG